MTERRKRRAELRIVETSPPDDGDGGGGSGPSPPPLERPTVKIVNGLRSAAIDEAERHLIGLDRDLFQRGASIVRVAPQQVDIGGGARAWTLAIVPVGVEHMRERLTRAIDLRRFDKRSNDWLAADCPRDLAEAYLERFGMWLVPSLRAVLTAPTLLPDGTVLDRPGYDRASRLYFDPRGVIFPPLAAAPTRGDALAALDRLKSELLPTFDFVDEASRSVALSGILTALLRPAMTAAPLHAYSAPIAGSGKSKLVNIAAVLRLGHHAPITTLGQRDEETEKRLGTALIAGDPIIALDNIDRALGGELLDQLVTEPLINARVLGKSLNFRVPNVHCLFATGNNLKFTGDMARRALMCRLDPQCENPELREFETPDPVVTAARHRSELVVAVLTIARAFYLAGAPNDLPPLGSFEEWSRWVRDPLLWLGEADPVETMRQVRREDPKLAALAAVLQQWRAVLGDGPFTVRQVAEKAAAETGFGGGFAHPEFREALLGVAAERGAVEPRRLGKWLGRVKGRRLDGLRLDEAMVQRGLQRWQLIAE